MQFVAVDRIVRNSCLLGGCHGNPPGAADGFGPRDPSSRLDVWTALTDSDMVVRCDAAQSSLLNPHNRDDGIYGPQQPDVLAAWINDGAKYCVSDPGCD